MINLMETKWWDEQARTKNCSFNVWEHLMAYQMQKHAINNVDVHSISEAFQRNYATAYSVSKIPGKPDCNTLPHSQWQPRTKQMRENKTQFNDFLYNFIYKARRHCQIQLVGLRISIPRTIANSITLHHKTQMRSFLEKPSTLATKPS